MQANLRGTPGNPEEVIVREVFDPIPNVILVDFGEVPEFSLQKTTVFPTHKIHRRAYKFVTTVVTKNRFGRTSEVAEYQLVDEV